MPELRNLTGQEIEKILKKFPNAKRIAVETFLMTVANNSNKYYANANLDKDRLLYGWNIDTARAIRKGIDLASKSLKVK